MAKGRDRAVGAAPMDQSFDVTIYIYAGNVLERWPRNSVSKSMSNEDGSDGHLGEWFDINRKQ